ncbi:hypothetical protein COT68_02965 [bacterium (Candidatus Torokbacteria) CG09_land_8_20_14_0_10_42_11]|nr:MAG: hypothetical protein COT68_02965 [bacterium (Candidatus Torokbacteria) CG09_land_8_20_14_0_10_42_11]
MPKNKHIRNTKKYFREPVYNIAGLFTDYLPTPIRWIIGLLLAGLIIVLAGFWGLVKFILGAFWIAAIFLIVALIYHIIKDKKKK